MKNTYKIILIILVMLLVIWLIFKILFNNNQNNEISKKNDNTFINEYEQIDKNQTAYKEEATVEELKKDVGLNENNDIYEIQTEYDGRKILTVKADLKFKVAFSGMIKRDIPKMNELDEVLQKKLPQKNGIWIDMYSSDKVLDLIKNCKKINSKYDVNKDGYLYIVEKNQQTDLDKKIENVINGNKLNILTRSSICYIVDDVTGEILDYNFEKMDKYQTYELFRDDNKSLLFITENSSKQLYDEDILESIISIM